MKTAEALTCPDHLIGEIGTDASGLNAWLSIQLHRWVARLVHVVMMTGELLCLPFQRKASYTDSASGINVPAGAREGDLVFALSRSLRARSLRLAFPDTRYTHVGILVRHKNEWQIIHARPGTLRHWFRDGGVRQETWEDFIQAAEIKDLTIFRAEGTKTEAIAKMARQTAQAGQPFDICYELSRQNAVYCTEFIWRLGLSFGQDWVEDRFMRFRFLWLSTKAIRPEALASSQHLQLMKL